MSQAPQHFGSFETHVICDAFVVVVVFFPSVSLPGHFPSLRHIQNNTHVYKSLGMWMSKIDIVWASHSTLCSKLVESVRKMTSDMHGPTVT